MLFERERLLQELQPEVDELRTALGESTASHAAEVQHGMQRPPVEIPWWPRSTSSAHCVRHTAFSRSRTQRPWWPRSRRQSILGTLSRAFGTRG